MLITTLIQSGRAWWTWSVLADGQVLYTGDTVTQGLAERRAESWRRVWARRTSGRSS